MNKNPNAETGGGNAPRVWPAGLGCGSNPKSRVNPLQPPTHEELEDARTNARLDAQAEREDQIQHERGDDES